MSGNETQISLFPLGIVQIWTQGPVWKGLSKIFETMDFSLPSQPIHSSAPLNSTLPVFIESSIYWVMNSPLIGQMNCEWCSWWEVKL